MKRFFCTICKKVKRVRRVPDNVDTPKAEVITDRIGQCRFHSKMGEGRARINDRGRVRSTFLQKSMKVGTK